MIDLTILLIPTDWDSERLARSIDSVARLMLESGLKVQCQITEFLLTGTDIARLRSQWIPALPAIVQRGLEREGFDYFVDYGTTVRGLRRAVRCAKGRYVCLLREGDEIGSRGIADQRLMQDADILVAVPGASGVSLAVHQRIAKRPLDCRALPALVGVATAYDGALLVGRDFLASLLGHVGYDAELGYYGFLNEVLTLALVRDSGRVQFTEQIAVFPDAHHLELHRKRICEYVLSCVVARRRGAVSAHEAGTETIIDSMLVRLAALFSETGAPIDSLVSPAPEHAWIAGRLTASVDTMLRWLAECVFWSWDWSPTQQPRRAIPAAPPDLSQRLQRPDVSLVASAFRGQTVIYGFFVNLLRQTAIDQCEVIVVTPEPNFVLDLVCEYFSLSVPQVRLIPLDHDPGIYGCWNIAIEASRGRYLSNANLDDRRDRTHIACLTGALEQTGADVASAAVAITHDLKELGEFQGDMERVDGGTGRKVCFGGMDSTVFEKGLRDFFLFDDHGVVTQCMNFPHCMPVWRRNLHDQHGLFDEQRDGTYADYALWLRGVSRGSRFVHLSAPLGLCFVGPRTHNRRNANVATWERIVRESLPANVSLRLPAHVEIAAASVPAPPAAASRHPCFNFGMQVSQYYGRHRSGWAYALQGLAGFDDPKSPVFCDAFIEKHFVWGADVGEGGVGPPEPHLEPWIGFIHVPPLVPTWFQFEQSNEQIFSTRAWQSSLPHCRGLFVLSEYHRRNLLEVLRPKFPINVLYHPTEFPEVAFDFDRYLANPKKRLVQIGWWLRKLTAIDRIPVAGHTPTLLGSSDWSKNLLTYAERRYHGIADPGGADVIDFLDNDAYDALLAENIAFVDFFDTSANNAVVECIARSTPIAVCRHPAVDEYLGVDYPLLYTDLAEAGKLIEDLGRVRAAHQYMKDDTLTRRFTLDVFSRSFANSEVARNAIY